MAFSKKTAIKSENMRHGENVCNAYNLQRLSTYNTEITPSQ